jgi:hypothetical protein
MPHKYAFAAAPLLALGLFAAAPCWAMSVVPAPTNSDGSPRFTDPAQSGFSGSDQKTSTFGGGSFSFGVTSSQGNAPGYYNQGYYNQGLSGREAVQSGYPDQGMPGQGFSNQGFFTGDHSGSSYPNRPFPYWAR